MSRSSDLRTAKKQSAFTLIELLVVIAIIAILAAILFPVFAQAKEAAKKAADLSNNKQILLGTMMYMTDYDDVFPMLRNDKPAWANPVTVPQVNSGHIVLNPYIKNKGLWKSPNDSMGRCDALASGYSSNEALPTGGPISYTFSYYGIPAGRTYGFGIAGWDSVSVSTGLSSSVMTPSLASGAVGAPAQTIWLIPSYISWSYWTGLMQHRNDQREYAFEPSQLSNGLATWPKVTSVPGAWCGAGDAMAVGAYGGQTNWGFADGHSKTMKRNQIMHTQWATAPATADANKLRNLIHFDESFKQ
ncbi:MAG: prepilin-type N-terminal cleavage/methylation domain-containing protein [Fimbriimonadaceae bacterium]|nr:prepilin-type N-terminal cleavage/methylation domain-containing protein [Fimbriimonadaceae bacterium]